jgi:hypothetical protein
LSLIQGRVTVHAIDHRDPTPEGDGHLLRIAAAKRLD